MASSNSTASFTAVNDGEFSHLDLTGKLIIKVSYGEDIRRIPIHNEDITYDELILMMQRVFRGLIRADDDVAVKYRDEDNDLISIADSADIQFAIQCSRVLKLTLFVNGRPQPLLTDEVKTIRHELQHIRNRCNALLDRLEAPRVLTSGGDSVDDKANESATTAPTKQVAQQPAHKEFDPLKSSALSNGPSHQPQATEDKRSASPDSVSSLSSQSRQQQGLGNVSAPDLRSLTTDHQPPGGHQFLSQQPSHPNSMIGQQFPPQQQQRFEVQAQPYPAQPFPAPNRQNVSAMPNSQSSPLGPAPPTSLSGPPPQHMTGYPGGQPSGPPSLGGFGGPPPQGSMNQPFGAPPPNARPPFGAPPPSGQLGGGPPPQQMMYSQSGSVAPTSTITTGPGGYGPSSQGPPPNFGHPSPVHGFGGPQGPPPPSQQPQMPPSQQQQQMPSGPYPGMGGPPPPSGPPTGGPPPMAGGMPGGMNPYSRGVGANRPRYPPNPGFPQQ